MVALRPHEPPDIALPTTGSRHPEQASRTQSGAATYWESFWDAEQVFYGHNLGFKGLERNAVVLAVNESQPHERSRERLYVGLSRARDQLDVTGDPAYIEAVVGPRSCNGSAVNGDDTATAFGQVGGSLACSACARWR